MTPARELLVIRPKARRQALFVIDGEQPEQARERRLKALPALGLVLLVAGYWFADSAEDLGFTTAPVVLGGLVAVIVAFLWVTTAAERHPAVRVTADELVVERWIGRPRRHPRDEIEAIETTRVVVGRVTDEQVTFVLGAPRRWLVGLLGPRRRTLLTLSHQHWDRADVDALARRLRVRHVVHQGEVLIMAQARRRYRGAFVVTTRRPFVSGVVGAVVLLAGIFGLVWAFA